MRKILASLMVLPLVVVLAVPTVSAFGCPKSIEKAQDAIDQAAAAMAKLPKDKQGLVHTLIDDAKMVLVSAEHNHKKPAAGNYDHARSIAKANTAYGYALAAQKLAKSLR
ncbi:MAG: hypothetical protein IH782_05965 [candidate division NC10 bacterium]|nr:hypothetical protein [candidate division NC10 bacterium]MCH7896425.1 hypothetical protein [candidate division NC10 bacterium]MCZ6550037.1 hypothetical protein [candidate division NC10 bacterium]